MLRAGRYVRLLRFNLPGQTTQGADSMSYTKPCQELPASHALVYVRFNPDFHERNKPNH